MEHKPKFAETFATLQRLRGKEKNVGTFEGIRAYFKVKGKGSQAMVMKLENEAKIEDPRHHSQERVETLRRLLAGGARVECDPKRPDFYEVESGSDVYYIHVSPVTGNILLLAAWPKDGVLGEEVRATQAA